MDKMLLDRVMEMKPADRVVFAELILASIEFEEDEVKKAWTDEVKARMDSVNSGRTKLIDFENYYHH